jgi:hypothetical protein
MTDTGLKSTEEQKRRSEVREINSLDEEIEDDRSAGKIDRRQLAKRENPLLDALEHCTRRKE